MTEFTTFAVRQASTEVIEFWTQTRCLGIHARNTQTNARHLEYTGWLKIKCYTK